MFDIGFLELTVIGVVLLIVLGPERLPEVARQAAFFVRKTRGWVYKIKAEMNIDGDETLESLRQAKRELSDFQTDMKQLGKDFANEANELASEDLLDGGAADIPDAYANAEETKVISGRKRKPKEEATKKTASKKKTTRKKTSKKKVTKKRAANKTTAADTAKTASTAKKTTKKKTAAKKTGKKATTRKKTTKATG